MSRPALVAAVAATAAFGAALAAGPVVATSASAAPVRMGVRQQVGDPGDESKEIKSAIAQFYGARSAPGAPGNIPPGAYTAAYEHVQSMGVTSAAWTNVTSRPYNSDSPRYRDPVASNSSGGAGYVTGRITGLALDGTTVYAGGAEGGVFRSSDEGKTWTPISDQLPALATGDLRVNPDDGSVWLGTGEANQGDGLGSGIYRLARGGSSFTPASRVGGKELESHSISKIEFDRAAGYVFAATSRGVYRHTLADTTSPWTVVLQPTSVDPPGAGLTARSNIANDVVVQPGSGGKRLIANVAYVGGDANNGFYLSTDAGTTWAKVNPTGAINPAEVGAANMAYSDDGSKLYVVLQSTTLYNKAGSGTSLAGVYVSGNGDVAGPYTQIASPSKLANSGSAQKQTVIGKGYLPGVQAWYNRFVAVDPADAQHVYVGLEEVYETGDGGASWKAAGRYWDFGFPCWNFDDAKNTCDGNVLHSDQHSVAIGNGRVYVGNDGGLYSRSLRDASSWTSLSESGQLGTLQYYSVGVGKLSTGGVAVWGGLQDNGVSLLSPRDGDMVSPFGGDGGDQIVDPDNGCNSLGEYVYLTLQVTNNCGESDGTKQAIYNIDPLDPNPQFIAPIAADPADGTWFAGGQLVYKNTLTWKSRSGSDWQIVGDQGSGHSATAVAAQNGVVWSGWCGSCSSGSYRSGLFTNAGGAWRAVGNKVVGSTVTTLPNRYIAGITIDPADASGNTAYVVYNGFSAHWVEGPGAGIGHVFKTSDGGATWRDVSGSPTASSGLPDVPASHMVITPSHQLVLTTDIGVFISPGDGTWKRLGTTLPYTIATDVRVGPDGRTYVATFGRGIWSTATPGGATSTGGKPTKR